MIGRFACRRISAPRPAVAAPPPAPAPPPPPPRPAAPASAAPLAHQFLVRTGALKGKRLPIRVPIVNIGRADYNDMVIPDDCVASQHAKLTRREGVWVLTDLAPPTARWWTARRSRARRC